MPRILRIDIDYPFGVSESESVIFVKIPEGASENDIEEIAYGAFLNKVNYGFSEVTEEEMESFGGELE